MPTGLLVSSLSSRDVDSINRQHTHLYLVSSHQDPNEDIGEAAIRELKEETGLDGTLERVLCMRQAHSEGRASDLFFICKLKLVNPNQTPVLQQEEIEELQWISPEDYCNQELWSESPVYQELNASILRAARHETAGLKEVKLPVGFRPGHNTLYMSNTDDI